MQTFTIGRNASNNIILADAMVSRKHAELFVLETGQVLIRDLGSSNGTFVNGNKVKETYLKPGDIVKCATTFLNWAQYVDDTLDVNPSLYKRDQPAAVVQPVTPNVEENDIPSDFSLGDTLKYLFIRIFSFDKLFKTSWDMTSPILFLSLIPLAIVFLAGIFIAVKFSLGFVNVVLFPMLLTIFLFGVSQFITLSLLSIKQDTNSTKNLLASSSFSFLQFLSVAIIGVPAVLLILFTGDSFSNLYNSVKNPVLPVLYSFVLVAAILSFSVTLIFMLYKYFRGIGVTNGISIHLVILSFVLNALLQTTFLFIFSLFLTDKMSGFGGIFNY